MAGRAVQIGASLHLGRAEEGRASAAHSYASHTAGWSSSPAPLGKRRPVAQKLAVAHASLATCEPSPSANPASG
jgi:hypothetical protein